MSRPRFSREEYQRQVEKLSRYATKARGYVGKGLHVRENEVRLWAAMLSEAAQRAPTHDELMADPVATEAP